MHRLSHLKFIYFIQNASFHTEIFKLNKYSSTVLLPKTKFPQRLTANIINQQNKHVYEKAGFEELYKWQQSNLSEPEFILHDGPPYANGLPHMGHAVNKIIKDVINRHNVLCKKRVNYVPGWDCHGLPIELKAMSKAKKAENTPLYIRTTARNFAAKTIEAQRKVFQSWGIMGDWKNPYLTYSVPYIKNQLQQFCKLHQKKLIYRAVKPVHWSPSSRTALAEAELEYNENHKSTAVIARYKLSHLPEILKKYVDPSAEIYALIWTTTPWTLPSNQAICYNPDFVYSFVKSPDKPVIYLLATGLVKSLQKDIKNELQILARFSGEELLNTKYHCPFKNGEELPFLPGQHPTLSKGTGLVHTAPAHGHEDFLLALTHKIPVKCIVDEVGKYTEDGGQFKGLFVLREGNEAVMEYLKKDILFKDEYVHSYPYDWRTKKPVIVRASQQWFIDTDAVKDRALELLKGVKIYPEKSSGVHKERLESQIKKRPYWCISRQRVWGTPIPVFYNIRTEEPIISESLINHLCGLLEKNGPDYWWKLPLAELFPEDLLKEHGVPLEDIKKGEDILDIWFDSGISWSSVLGEEKISDVYVEGVDQFTGWFQSSLITSVALRDKAPYKTIYVHGFAVDENGHKMSKSLGNVVDPQEIIHGAKKQQALGVDTLRWWVMCHASQNSTAYVSSNVLQASADEVQKIRNTLRFAVGSLNDFPNESIPFSSLKLIDKYMLHLLHEFNSQVENLYKDYQFNRLCINVINFVTTPVSAFYYSIIKDRLYCSSAEDVDRKSAQFVLNIILNTVSKAIAPIVPHLVEELHMYRAHKEEDNFFKGAKNWIGPEFYQPEIAQVMESVLNMKKELNKQAGNTLDLRVEILASGDIFKDLQIFSSTNELSEILQVSQVDLKESEEIPAGTYKIATNTTDAFLCPRCRRFTAATNDQLCHRCTTVVNSSQKVAVSAQ